jgi:Shikimate 5-dehydrogenase
LRLYGLIGYPLGHSFSKRYFTEKFEREGILDARYELFPLEDIALMPQLLAQRPELRGLNVTIPHKERILPFLHEMDDTVRAVGAVNCVRIGPDGRLTGFNTDVIGFEETVWAFAGGVARALVLGTGGAAKAAAYVLQKKGLPFQFVSRSGTDGSTISYASAFDPKNNDGGPLLLVNATPVGTYPRTDEMPPVPPSFFRPGMFVYDMTYNPAETLLLRVAKASGCAVKNGMEMLEKQAAAAWDIWQSPTFYDRH